MSRMSASPVRARRGPARPRRRQVAALCWREGEAGPEVLLITSRGTGRWIVPKGWPIEGLDDAETALREAWEEAGVREAEIAAEPVGHFDYVKEMKDGALADIEAEVYLARVERLAPRYPEAGERRRRWVSARRAATMIREAGLKRLLRAL